MPGHSDASCHRMINYVMKAQFFKYHLEVVSKIHQSHKKFIHGKPCYHPVHNVKDIWTMLLEEEQAPHLLNFDENGLIRSILDDSSINGIINTSSLHDYPCEYMPIKLCMLVKRIGLLNPPRRKITLCMPP
jgi:hypothetical protein